MEILSAVAIVIAAFAGFLLGKKNSSNEVEKSRLEQELKKKTAELETFHAKVNSHFEKTSELFNHVSDSYQSLYDHMAKSSNQLCASQPFQVLLKGSEHQDELNAESPLKQSTSQDIAQGDLFDAEQLYKAHEYRNKAAEEPPETLPDDNKVVEIASAKENMEAQALDYAIKEKGVINHNSLEIDGLKNSK